MKELIESAAAALAAHSGLSAATWYNATLVIIILAVAAAEWVAVCTLYSFFEDEPMSFEEALAPGMPRLLWWAGRWFPEAWERFHFAVAGACCTGKSILLTLYVKSLLPRITPGSDSRLVLFDPKNQLNASLFAKVPVAVHYILPSDERSSRWHIAKDVTTPAAGAELAEALLPAAQGDTNEFFMQAVREVVGAVINSLNTTHPGAWDLADVVRILEDHDILVQVLERAGPPSTLRLMAEPRTWANIEATLATHLGALRILAAMWSPAGRRDTFSITQFVNGEGVIVLGRDPRLPLLDRLNALFFTRLSSHLLAQDHSATRRTYLVIDGLEEAAGGRPLPGFEGLCVRGAPRGVVIAVAYQSYAQVKELYREGADAILGMLQNRVFLRAGDTPTAQFASTVFGNKRRISDHWHEQDVVPYERFFELPPASPEDGITGYWLSPPPVLRGADDGGTSRNRARARRP